MQSACFLVRCLCDAIFGQRQRSRAFAGGLLLIGLICSAGVAAAQDPCAPIDAAPQLFFTVNGSLNGQATFQTIYGGIISETGYYNLTNSYTITLTPYSGNPKLYQAQSVSGSGSLDEGDVEQIPSSLGGPLTQSQTAQGPLTVYPNTSLFFSSNSQGQCVVVPTIAVSSPWVDTTTFNGGTSTTSGPELGIYDLLGVYGPGSMTLPSSGSPTSTFSQTTPVSFPSFLSPVTFTYAGVITGSVTWTLTENPCDSNRTALIQQYTGNPFPGYTGITDSVTGSQFVPTCQEITTSAGSTNYDFASLNISNTTATSVALLANSLITGQGVSCYHYTGLAPSCGLDTWVADFGSVPDLTSGFRPPLDQVRVYQALNKTPKPFGRHMFGDAVDLVVTPAGNATQWNALVNAAINAGADYTESDAAARLQNLSCGPAQMKCVHADWRFATSLNGGTQPYAQ